MRGERKWEREEEGEGEIQSTSETPLLESDCWQQGGPNGWR